MLNQVNWIKNQVFSETIGKYSQSFAGAIASFREIVADHPGQSMKEYGSPGRPGRSSPSPPLRR
jgi:hypothetical protein